MDRTWEHCQQKTTVSRHNAAMHTGLSTRVLIFLAGMVHFGGAVCFPKHLLVCTNTLCPHANDMSTHK